MKKILIPFAIIFSLGFIFSCSSPESKTEVEVVKTEKKEVLAENKETVDMKVEGMVCAMGCAKYIEDKVADLDGVTLSTVDFEKGLAHFEFDKTVTSPQDLEKFIVEIHEGQYQAKIVSAEELEEIKQENLDENNSSSDESELEVAAVYENIQFSIPDLLGYFLHNIR